MGPIIGANVLEKGTTNGVITDIDGNFTLNVKPGATLVISYIGYMNQEGTIIGSAFERFSVRTNLDAQLKEWLKLGLSATYSTTDEQLKLADSSEGIINYSLTTLPDIPIYDVDGNYASEVREGWTSPNPVAMAMLNEINLKRQQLGLRAEELKYLLAAEELRDLQRRDRQALLHGHGGTGVLGVVVRLQQRDQYQPAIQRHPQSGTGTGYALHQHRIRQQCHGLLLHARNL